MISQGRESPSGKGLLKEEKLLFLSMLCEFDSNFTAGNTLFEASKYASFWLPGPDRIWASQKPHRHDAGYADRGCKTTAK